MHCPFCTNEDTQVKDSRQAEDGSAIRRRRICGQCGSRFTTYERIQLREIIVIKKDGKKKPFNRDKLVSSIGISLRKRPVSLEKLEITVNNIVKNLESLGENEIKSDVIGQMVMETLKDLDPVAYVRFASVYREFREAKDFEDFIGQIQQVNQN